MNEDVRERLNRLKGKYAQKYGTLMDDWTSMVLEEFREIFEQLTGQVKDTTEVIKEAQFKIRKSQRVLQFTTGKQAWLHGIGETVPLALAIVLIAMLIFYPAYTERRFEEIRNAVNTYENLKDYTVLAQNGRITEKKKIRYLVLKIAPEGEPTPGLHFVFDSKKQEVLVPLNQNSTHKTAK